MRRYRTERLAAEDQGIDTQFEIDRFLNDHAMYHPEERIVSILPWMHGGKISDYLVVYETGEE